ncbi:hypothetical protein HYC85_005647 [Camellia sinensis]|uniref:CCHC-type domain-containing protein n=1 Tax=Camellia sinensis TaxID=4442 RepID=A0A7J7I029_CAMSI|nr:hypothetical protein HYC85_005647 [Camellia sinensis]
MESLALLEGTDETADVSERCSVGKILAPKNLNKQAVTNIIHSAWKTRASVRISPWNENVYLFQFDELEDRRGVLEDAPWSVMGSLLVLQPLQSGMVTSELEFRWCPFWVQVHGLPIAKLTRGHGETIGRRLGRLVRVEAHSEGLLLQRNFLRIRVEIDITKPLLQGFILHCREKGEAPGGAGLTVLYKYEKLSEFCYDCGRIGHDRNACKFVSLDEGINSGYGPHIRTTAARSLGSPFAPAQRQVDTAEMRAQPQLQPNKEVTEQRAARAGIACVTQLGVTDQLAPAASIRPSSRVLPRCTSDIVGAPRGAGTRATSPTLESSAEPAIYTTLGGQLDGSGLRAMGEIAHHFGPQVNWATKLALVPLNEALSQTVLNSTAVCGPQYFVTEPFNLPPSFRAHSAESLALATESLGADEMVSTVSPSMELLRCTYRRPLWISPSNGRFLQKTLMSFGHLNC